MIIDTVEEASTMRKTKAFVIIFCVILIFITAIFTRLPGIYKTIIYSVLSVVMILFYWYQYNMKYSYFYFSNNTKNLIFKFYSLRHFSGSPQTIEIAKLNFKKYEIEKAFFNKRESLILYQKTPNGVAKYPPISLSLLSKKQKKELESALSYK